MCWRGGCQWRMYGNRKNRTMLLLLLLMLGRNDEIGEDAVLVKDLLDELTGRGRCQLKWHRLPAIVAHYLHGCGTHDLFDLVAQLQLK